MRRLFLLSGVATLFLMAPAFAADMPTKAYNAATPPAASGWGGGYVGIEVLYGWNEVKATLVDKTLFDPSKFVFGGAAGYRWGNTLVFGLELSGKYAGANQQIVPGLNGSLRYYGDVSAQLGIAPNSGILLYAIAGPSLANSQISSGPMISTANYFGWHVGGGIDIKAFTENVILGLQYKHHEWGNGTFLGALDTAAKNDEVVARLMYRFSPGH